ncbi:unnamed protein product [Symbiodinium sp. CCMP2456]|nr:unnamed protein product [Symbiodinium sp. CCMP2456]
MAAGQEQEPLDVAKAEAAKGKKKAGAKGAATAKAAGGPIFMPPQAQVLQPTVQVPRRFPGHFMPHRLCNHWNLQGWCKKAETCTFAHGIEELHPDVQAQLLQQKPGMPPPTVTKDGRLVVHGVSTVSKPAGKVATETVGYPTAQMQSALASLYGAQANSLLGSGTTTLSPFASVTNFPFNLTPGTVPSALPALLSQPGGPGLSDLKENLSDPEDGLCSSSPGTPSKRVTGRPAPAPLSLDDISPADGQAMMVRPLVSPSVAAQYTTIRTQPMASPMRVPLVSRPLPSPISTGTPTAGAMSNTATSVAMAAISTPKAVPAPSLTSPARVTAHFSVRTPTSGLVWPGSPTKVISPAQPATPEVPIDRSTLLQARQVAVRLDQGPPGLAMWAPTPTTKAETSPRLSCLLVRSWPGYVSVAPRTPGSGLCRACENSQRWDVALFVLEEHFTLLDAIACTALMRLLGAAKQWRRCLEVFRDMCRSGPVPDAMALCAVVTSCANSASWPQVLVLLEDAWSQVWKPNTVVYNSAISACAREEDWEEALALAEDLSDHSLRADAVTCSSLVSACEKGKQWQLALLLFCHSPSRNAVAASAALSAFAKADKNAVSVALLRSLAGLQVEPSAAAFNAASSTRYWKESLLFLLWGEVLGVAATAASAGAKVKAFESGSQWQSILSLGRLGSRAGGGAAGMVSAVSACEEASEWARTTALLLQAPLPPSVAAWNSAMASEGWRAALSSLDRLRLVRGGPDAFSYNLVIKKTCDGSSWQCALCLLKEMDEQQLAVDMLTYHMVMTAQMNGLHWAECLATLQAMEEAHVDDPGILAYGPAVGACLRTLQWEQALLIVQRLRQRRQLPDSPMMNSCITVCERAGQWQLALQIYRDMCLFGPAPDETTCNAALAACARGTRWQWALDLLARSESERPEALGCVLEALQLSAKWHQAMELWSLQPKPNVICTSSVLLACSRAQRWPRVAALQEDSADSLMEASRDLHRGVLELAHANIVVALLDALEVYREREAAAFRKTLYDPAKRQLVRLSRFAAVPDLMAGEAVLRCKLLERQSSLGRFFVHRFCSELFGSPSKVQGAGAKASRRAMAQAGGIWDERPVAKHILAWVVPADVWACVLVMITGSCSAGSSWQLLAKGLGSADIALITRWNIRGPHMPSARIGRASVEEVVIPVVGRRYPDEIFSALRGAGCLAGPDPASQLLELRTPQSHLQDHDIALWFWCAGSADARTGKKTSHTRKREVRFPSQNTSEYARHSAEHAIQQLRVKTSLLNCVWGPNTSCERDSSSHRGRETTNDLKNFIALPCWFGERDVFPVHFPRSSGWQPFVARLTPEDGPCGTLDGLMSVDFRQGASTRESWYRSLVRGDRQELAALEPPGDPGCPSMPFVTWRPSVPSAVLSLKQPLAEGTGWVDREKDPPPAYSGSHPQVTLKQWLRDLEKEKQGLKIAQALSAQQSRSSTLWRLALLKKAEGYLRYRQSNLLANEGDRRFVNSFVISAKAVALSGNAGLQSKVGQQRIRGVGSKTAGVDILRLAFKGLELPLEQWFEAGGLILCLRTGFAALRATREKAPAQVAPSVGITAMESQAVVHIQKSPALLSLRFAGPLGVQIHRVDKQSEAKLVLRKFVKSFLESGNAALEASMVSEDVPLLGRFDWKRSGPRCAARAARKWKGYTELYLTKKSVEEVKAAHPEGNYAIASTTRSDDAKEKDITEERGHCGSKRTQQSGARSSRAVRVLSYEESAKLREEGKLDRIIGSRFVRRPSRWAKHVGERAAVTQSNPLLVDKGNFTSGSPVGLPGMAADQLIEIAVGVYGLIDGPVHWRKTLTGYVTFKLYCDGAASSGWCFGDCDIRPARLHESGKFKAPDGTIAVTMEKFVLERLAPITIARSNRRICLKGPVRLDGSSGGLRQVAEEGQLPVSGGDPVVAEGPGRRDVDHLPLKEDFGLELVLQRSDSDDELISELSIVDATSLYDHPTRDGSPVQDNLDVSIAKESIDGLGMKVGWVDHQSMINGRSRSQQRPR